MSLPVTLKRLAQAEFDDAVDRFESKRAGRGIEFNSAIRSIFDEISNDPKRYPEVRDDIREALVRDFQYAVYYRIETAQVVVLAVFHTSRDPVEWQRRA